MTVSIRSLLFKILILVLFNGGGRFFVFSNADAGVLDDIVELGMYPPRADHPTFTVSLSLPSDFAMTLQGQVIRNMLPEFENRLLRADREFIRANFGQVYSRLRVSVTKQRSAEGSVLVLSDLPIYYAPLFLSFPTYVDHQHVPLGMDVLQLLLSLSLEGLPAAEREVFLSFPELTGELLERVNQSPFIVKNGPVNLGFACREARLEAFEFLSHTSAWGKLLQASSEAKTSVLHYACKNGTFEQIRRLVEANPSLLAQKTSEGLTPIMSCTISGREDAAIFLIDLDVRARGVNALLSDATIDGQTLLEWAGQFDRRKVLKKVLNLASIQLDLLPSSLSRVIKPLVHRLEDLLGLEASPVAESQPSRLRSALERIQERRRRE